MACAHSAASICSLKPHLGKPFSSFTAVHALPESAESSQQPYCERELDPLPRDRAEPCCPPRPRSLPGLASLPFLGLSGTGACSPGSFSFPFRRMGLREGGFARDGKAAWNREGESGSVTNMETEPYSTWFYHFLGGTTPLGFFPSTPHLRTPETVRALCAVWGPPGAPGRTPPGAATGVSCRSHAREGVKPASHSGFQTRKRLRDAATHPRSELTGSRAGSHPPAERPGTGLPGQGRQPQPQPQRDEDSRDGLLAPVPPVTHWCPWLSGKSPRTSGPGGPSGRHGCSCGVPPTAAPRAGCGATANGHRVPV